MRLGAAFAVSNDALGPARDRHDDERTRLIVDRSREGDATAIGDHAAPYSSLGSDVSWTGVPSLTFLRVQVARAVSVRARGVDDLRALRRERRIGFPARVSMSAGGSSRRSR